MAKCPLQINIRWYSTKGNIRTNLEYFPLECVMHMVLFLHTPGRHHTRVGKYKNKS